MYDFLSLGQLHSDGMHCVFEKKEETRFVTAGTDCFRMFSRFGFFALPPWDWTVLFDVTGVNANGGYVV